jgi:hypothetical protein
MLLGGVLEELGVVCEVEVAVEVGAGDGVEDGEAVGLVHDLLP